MPVMRKLHLKISLCDILRYSPACQACVQCFCPLTSWELGAGVGFQIQQAENKVIYSQERPALIPMEYACTVHGDRSTRPMTLRTALYCVYQTEDVSESGQYNRAMLQCGRPHLSFSELPSSASGPKLTEPE